MLSPMIMPDIQRHMPGKTDAIGIRDIIASVFIVPLKDNSLQPGIGPRVAVRTLGAMHHPAAAESKAGALNLPGTTGIEPTNNAAVDEVFP